MRSPAPRLGTAWSVLAALRGGVDQLTFRCLGELESAWQGGRARGVLPPRRDVLLVQAMAGRTTDPEVLARALSYALREGAFESVGALVERLLPQLQRLNDTSRARALEDTVDSLVALGERSRAAALARRNPSLAHSPRGCTLLDLLELSGGGYWLPGGRPNLVALSRAIELGSLDAAGLRALVARRPWSWLLHPELHLLAFAAAGSGDRRRGLLSLNRFLARHGLPRFGLREPEAEGDNVLAELVMLDEAPTEPKGPLVSVVVAARNAHSTVRYALQSLLTQTHSTLEILVCDDASDDGTLAILRDFRRMDSRVRVFRSLRQQGAYNVRNALAGYARGELLTFHDADDLALSTRIAQQVQQLHGGRASACVTSLVRTTPGGSVVFHKDQKATRLGLVTLMLRRRSFLELGGFRSVHFGGDWELYVKLRELLGANGLRRIKTPLMLGLCSAGSSTRRTGSEALEDGYRSPARRLYSEIVLGEQGLAPAVSAFDQHARLRESGNYVEAAATVELDPD